MNSCKNIVIRTNIGICFNHVEFLMRSMNSCKNIVIRTSITTCFNHVEFLMRSMNSCSLVALAQGLNTPHIYAYLQIRTRRQSLHEARHYLPAKYTAIEYPTVSKDTQILFIRLYIGLKPNATRVVLRTSITICFKDEEIIMRNMNSCTLVALAQCYTSCATHKYWHLF